jgi:N-succinyldiaminopimelate aminotransferase
LPELREAVADHNRRFYDIEVEPATDVLITAGATEGIAATILGLVNPGDEVVVFEPLYDSYVPNVELAGGTPVYVRLEPPSWRLSKEALDAAFGPATKLVVLNSPMNPAGKVFDRKELELLADYVRRYDAYVLCDEVYEHIVFDGVKHVPLMTLPGMEERCLRIGSAGKTFSLTGWKTGYVNGPAALIAAIAKVHQYLVFAVPPNLQRAVAHGLGLDDSYFEGLSAQMQARRDLLRSGLEDIGFAVAECAGTYFLNADFRPLGFVGDDVEFCRHITKEAGVGAIPCSAFYHDGSVRNWVRFCFCKDESTLEEALKRLRAHFV